MVSKKQKEQDLKKKYKNPYIEWYPDIRNLKEALSIKARRKLAQRMIRDVQKMVVARKKAASRFASNKNLKIRVSKLARSAVKKRIAGKRGEMYSKLGLAAKMAIDKLTDKQKSQVAKIAKQIMPAVRRAESQRLSKKRLGSDNKQDKRHKKKFHGS